MHRAHAHAHIFTKVGAYAQLPSEGEEEKNLKQLMKTNSTAKMRNSTARVRNSTAVIKSGDGLGSISGDARAQAVLEGEDSDEEDER